MQAQINAPASGRRTPGWVWWTLVIGAGVLFLWAWFLFGFLAEPSAVGRSRAVLGILGGGSIGTACLGLIAAAGLLRNARWAPRLGLVAAVFMILTGVGAIAGIPAVFGIASNRNSART